MGVLPNGSPEPSLASVWPLMPSAPRFSPTSKSSYASMPFRETVDVYFGQNFRPIPRRNARRVDRVASPRHSAVIFIGVRSPQRSDNPEPAASFIGGGSALTLDGEPARRGFRHGSEKKLEKGRTTAYPPNGLVLDAERALARRGGKDGHATKGPGPSFCLLCLGWERRHSVGPPMSTTQDETIADLQRANAALRQQLDEQRSRLATRDTEFDERIEHQATIINVLRVMSASPGDTRAVFDLILRRASELCESRTQVLWEFDGTLLRPPLFASFPHHQIGTLSRRGRSWNGG